MRKIYSFFRLLLAVTLIGFSSCGKADTEPGNSQYYENHNISACRVKDPLKNIDWVKKYCDSLKAIQNFSSVHIDLYKVIDTEDNVFKINISYSELDDSPFSYTINWINCAGKTIICLNSGTSPSPDALEKYQEFLQDKE
jgi:hypothetical protein